MARIRSIKPEFFTSETIAALPLSARLTFIGLWTYVDDNGVGVDNPRLITAALFPLDEDPLEALRRVSGDLMQLSSAGLIVRYEIEGRRYVFVRSWAEHQKVQHPGKPRYPRPGEVPHTLVTSEDEKTHEVFRKPSGDFHESLTPEQGAGSREQGYTSSADADGAPAPAPKTKRTRTPKAAAAPGFDAFWAAYPKKVGKPAALKAYAKATAEGADPAAILDGARLYAMQCSTIDDPHYIKHPQGWLNDGRWADETSTAAPRQRSAPGTPPTPTPPPYQAVAAGLGLDRHDADDADRRSRGVALARAAINGHVGAVTDSDPPF